MVKARAVVNGVVDLASTVGYHAGRQADRISGVAVDASRYVASSMGTSSMASRFVRKRTDTVLDKSFLKATDDIAAEGMDVAGNKNLLRATDDIAAEGMDAAKTVQKKATKNMCLKNKKMCMAAAVGTAAGAYGGIQLNKKYKEMKKEEQQCMSMCAPDDWGEYTQGIKDKPTYKTKDAVSPYDPEIKYEVLYTEEGIADQLCTEENLLKSGVKVDVKGCETFCESVCDFTLSDAAEELAGDAASSLWNNTVGPVLDPIFDMFTDLVNNPMFKYGLIFVLCIFLFFILSLFM
jgi:hypothetical protein